MTITDTTPATDTTEAPELATTLTVPYADALRGIAAVLPHCAKNDMTPIIDAVHIDHERFTTTDRYTIARFAHEAGIHPDTDAVVIPRTAAEWLTKQTAKMLDHFIGYLNSMARVTFTPTSITITADGATLALTTFAEVTGNFPPVGRLLDGWEAAGDAQMVALGGTLLTHFATSAAKLARTARDAEPLRFELGKPSSSGKPGPLRVTIGKRFDGLIQPNLIRD